MPDIDALHEAQMEAEHHREQERFWKGRCEELEAAQLSPADARWLLAAMWPSADHGFERAAGPPREVQQAIITKLRLRARAAERET